MMNQESPNQDGVRKPVLIALVALALVAGGFVFMRTRGSKPDAAPEPTPDPTPARIVKASRESPPPELAATTPVEPAPPSTPPATTAPKRMAVMTAGIPRGPEPSPETRRLVSTLANLDLNPATLTPEAAAAWKQNLQALIQNGAAAVPAIQEFLALNKDVAFDASPGAAGQLGSPSLRLSLLEALGNIGGPEALALSAQALGGTTDPREIALLANSLERQAPEQYREMALSAARAALAQAGSGNPSGKDLGPLFGVLTQFGGAGAVADLQQAAAGQFKYYATIALAQLPEGAGVPALIQMATDASSAGGGGRLAAMQMLGQAAADNPDARNALLKLAQGGSIPNATWINIAAAVSGERFQIGTIDAQTNPNVRTWHLNYGNQNYWASPVPLTQAQVEQNMALADQLIASNPGPAALVALEDAKNKLRGRTGAP